MSRPTPRSLLSSTGRRTAAAALLAQAPVLLLAGPVPSAHAAAPGTAVPAPGSVDCGVQQLAMSDEGARTDVRVALPERLSGVPLLPGAFSLAQADEPVAITVRRRPAAEQAVAVVLASSATSSPARFDAARTAALALLDGLRPETRTAVASTTSPTPLAPLSLDRRRAARSLQLATAGAGASAVTTVDTIARALPADADVVLFSDGAAEGAEREVQALTRRLQARGVVLSRIAYAGTPSTGQAGAWAASPSQRACAAATAGAPLARQVERVRGVLADQYRVSAATGLTAPATLSVQAAGAASSIQLSPVNPVSTVSDPYERRDRWGWTALLSLVAAGELAVLGLLLLLRPGRRRRSAVGGTTAADRRAAPVDTGGAPHGVDRGVSADR